MTMKRTIIILLAIMTLAPAALCAQDTESLSNTWGFGFQVGVGGALPTGSHVDEFKSFALFTGGLNAEYNRLRFKADIAYGQPSFKNNNPYDVFDSEGRDLQLNGTASTTMLGAGLQLGYTVWQQGKISVTPAVGVNFNRLSWDINHIKYERDDEGQERPMIENVTSTHENSFGWMVSLDIDFKLHGKLVDAPFGGDDQQAHYISSVRLSPFVAQAKYSNLVPSVKGCCVGITLSYAGLLRTIK